MNRPIQITANAQAVPDCRHVSMKSGDTWQWHNVGHYTAFIDFNGRPPTGCPPEIEIAPGAFSAAYTAAGPRGSFKYSIRVGKQINDPTIFVDD